jgi:hypothetical protein
MQKRSWISRDLLPTRVGRLATINRWIDRLACCGHAGGMAGSCAVSRLFAGLHPGGRFRVAKPRARGLGVLAGVLVAIIAVAITLIGIPISLMLLAVYLAAIYLGKLWVGAFLGRILLKPAGGHKTRLAAGIAGRPVDPHHRRVHSIFWWPGSLDCSLPGMGSVRQLYQASRPVTTS